MTKKILVTGSNGQLGREICKLYENNNEVEIIPTDVGELDITDILATTNLIEEVKPYAIINCAAYTAVDACEKDIELAYKINAIGPRNLSIAGSKVGAKIVHVSTDYVFSGDGTRPYTEFDTPNPTSMYGKTKLEGEKFVMEFSDKYFIIRTAWLYGDGKNFVKTMLKLSETHDEISVVNDQVGSPTSTKVLADIINALVFTENYGIFHGTCEGDCSWADFTKEIFRLTGKTTKVNAISTEEYMKANPSSAKRPAYSILENYMLKLTTKHMAADWHEALEEYLKPLS